VAVQRLVYWPDTGIETPMLADGSVIMSGADLMGTRAFGAILDPGQLWPHGVRENLNAKGSCSTVPDDAVLSNRYPEPC
jgi:hypothetical protein